MSGSASRVGAVSALFNISFASVKMVTGVLGGSFALIADGIESLADSLSSLIVWSGLRFSEKEADAGHPYGHGKAESLAAFVASICLGLSACFIMFQSVREILRPQEAPALFTLLVAAGIIITKEVLYRYMSRRARELNSEALRVDAWHHRLDSLTTGAVFCGILIAVIGGESWVVADDIAALLIGAFILYNAVRLSSPSVLALLDTDAGSDYKADVLAVAETVPGVLAIESMRVLRSGTEYVIDIHLEVEATISVHEGHDIAHRLRETLLADSALRIRHVMTHIEPFGRYPR